MIAAPLLFCAPPVGAQDQSLKELEQQQEQERAKAEALSAKAQALHNEAEALRVFMINTARKAQDREAALSTIEAKLAELEAEEVEKMAALATRNQQLQRTLAALQRIALQPPEALIAAPGSPIDTVRSAMLLRVAVPQIETRADLLRDELAELTALRGLIRSEKLQLNRTAGELADEQERIARLILRKKELEATTSAEQQVAAVRSRKWASQAANLRDLLARVEQEAKDQADKAERGRQARADAARLSQEQAERERQAEAAVSEAGQREAEAADAPETAAAAPETQMARLQKPAELRAFPRKRQSLTLPVRGKIVLQYGELATAGANEGSTAKGITFATRPRAQVVAPFDGKIAYAGDFRGYGQILIIDHGGRYHTLLAGLDRIDAVVGQWVLAGEPVAQMGQPETHDPELYLELRRTGQPVNPLPWLATTNDKVQG